MFSMHAGCSNLFLIILLLLITHNPTTGQPAEKNLDIEYSVLMRQWLDEGESHMIVLQTTSIFFCFSARCPSNKSNHANILIYVLLISIHSEAVWRCVPKLSYQLLIRLVIEYIYDWFFNVWVLHTKYSGSGQLGCKVEKSFHARQNFIYVIKSPKTDVFTICPTTSVCLTTTSLPAKSACQAKN